MVNSLCVIDLSEVRLRIYLSDLIFCVLKFCKNEKAVGMTMPIVFLGKAENGCFEILTKEV